MKFTLKIIDTLQKFEVKVYFNEKLIHTTGWKGGEFLYQGKWYAVYGPYHYLGAGGQFRVYELVPVSEVA